MVHLLLRAPWRISCYETRVIHLREVTKIYGTRKVLDRVSLNFGMGKTHVLLGPSGCGKSTLLRLILGLIDSTSGSLTLDGLEVTSRTQSQVALRVGYVVQEGGLFPHLTAAQNMALSAKTRGWTKEKIFGRIFELARLAELEESTLRRFPRQLSGGQRQRVGLLRALMTDPSLLLLDEPLGALDPMVRSSLQASLKKIFNTVRKTVILVTHDIGEAAFFGHTITLLNEGKVCQQGTLQELVESPASPFVTEFLNSQRPVPELRVLL
jgi:osmoprotectant transport system ATP-binding protein